MQTTTFDGIVRELGRGTSRHRALRLLAGGIRGAVLASASLTTANAKPGCLDICRCRTPGAWMT